MAAGHMLSSPSSMTGSFQHSIVAMRIVAWGVKVGVGWRRVEVVNNLFLLRRSVEYLFSFIFVELIACHFTSHFLLLSIPSYTIHNLQ